MAESRVAERVLRRVLWELRDYLPDLLLIGGWVPFLYRRYAGFRSWHGPESLTLEVDILTQRTLPTGDRPPIAERLHEVGFQPLGRPGRSAIWIRHTEEGARIEFFVDHRGTARTRGSVRSIRQQPGLGAISLAGLSFMRENSGVLTVPVENADSKEMLLDVRVPLLGAFAVNKAVTFPQRVEGVSVAGESKRAKDLLYLRDLMAAGPDVTRHIEQEIKAFRGKSGRTTDLVDAAANNLRLLQRGQWAADVRSAGRMLLERGDQSNPDAGLADIMGHLDDFLDMLTDKQPE